MKILILPDLINNWSAHNRAKAIQKFIPEHEFTIRQGLGDDSCLSGHMDFDLIHFNFTYGITDFFDFIMLNKHRVVITVINERSLLAGYGVDVDKLTRLLVECPWVTSVSKKIAARINLLRSDEPGVRYIPNGIDEDIFSRFKRPVVGYAGTDKPNKNASVIIKACEELGLIYRQALYNNGAPGLSHSQMQDFYTALDVYVHASVTEGFNNTVLEALACNIPVLMTRQGCWHEFEGYVEFIEPTVESVKAALLKYAGRRLVLDKFTWPKIMPQYKKIYEEAYNALRLNV